MPSSFASDEIVKCLSCRVMNNDRAHADGALAEVQRSTESVLGKSAPASRPEELKDEFGIPLIALGKGVEVAAERSTIEGWKREAVALVVAEHLLGRTEIDFSGGKREDKYSVFDTAVAEARVPDCLHKDGLKRQPPRVAFFVFQGVLALPFVALAKVRGKCI